MHLRLTSASNKDHYTSGSGHQKYPDVFLLLDENDVLDEMFDEALIEFNGGQEKKKRKSGKIETGEKYFLMNTTERCRN
jgi:hypothetical protein